MIITKEKPASWQDLQDKVCKYLNESGYSAETTKTIDLVRGKVEVDVFATTDDEILSQFICECKFWERPVPQEKIHAFRTVVQDSGSMLGIFISKAGYQVGAVEAARCSNVLLKDWDGFIELIGRRWVSHRFGKILKAALPLSVYTDPLDIQSSFFENESKKKAFEQLLLKYGRLYLLIRSLEFGYHPIEDPIVLEGIHFEDFKTLFDFLDHEVSEAIDEYGHLFSEGDVAEWKLEFSKKMLLRNHILDYID